MKKMEKTRVSRDEVARAMSEVHTNIPSTVKATGKKGEAKEEMLRAVAFSKARQAKKKK